MAADDATVRALRAAGDQVHEALADAVAANDAEIAHLSEATIDYLGRIHRVSRHVQAAIAAGDITRAARGAAQIAALAGMADQRMQCAMARRTATLEAAGRVLGAIADGRVIRARTRPVEVPL